MALTRNKQDFCFLHTRDTNGLKSYLESLPKDSKGSAFESLLAELYRGNGWLVKRQGGRGDAGADILLYHPKTPSKVSLIIQAKNHTLPLTFDQTRIELVKFEEQSAHKHNCQNFRLVSVSGFVKDAEKLGEFNMLLDGWEHVEKLIGSYDAETTTEPVIELFAHNRNTYYRINELWDNYRHVAVIQATGTGKSFLIAKVLADFLDKRKVVLAPSNYILEQQQSKMPWLSSSTDYLTYAKLARMNSKEIKALDAGLIVLDEFHRCGAEVWGSGVKKLLDCHPDSKVLGTSATPIRYLDNNRDMAEELFDGLVAEELSLAEAIIRRILPPPTYISALYTLNEECEFLLEDIEASKRSDAEKAELKREVNAIKMNWEKTSGVPEILKKHLPSNINKLIVFCKDQQHLDEMEVEVQRWFQKAGTHRWRKVYRVLSVDPDSDHNLEEFKKATGKDSVHLLFAIDMLNEGLHIPDVGAVILLRPTVSPIIFYQQIGRCIQVGKEQPPIIFDLVNNFQNVSADNFISDLNKAKEVETVRRSACGLVEYFPNIIITELSSPIEAIFEAIRERLVPWDVMFERLIAFTDDYGHALVPASYITNDGCLLGSWVSDQRKNARISRLTQDRILRLGSVRGWSWNPNDDSWETGFQHLEDYEKITGHSLVPATYKTSNGFALGVWVNEQRKSKKQNQLSSDKALRLEKINGWTYDVIGYKWEIGFCKYAMYIENTGKTSISKFYKDPDGYPLKNWVTTQRCSKDKLTPDKVSRLESLPGWGWDLFNQKWEIGFRHLMEFIEIYGHPRVPQEYIAQDGYKLGGWIRAQRKANDDNKISVDRKAQLEALSGWCWNVNAAQWEEGFEHLIQFVEVEGHSKVPSKYIAPDGYKLGDWVTRQKADQSKRELNDDRKIRLEELPGWEWWKPRRVKYE